MNLLWFLCGLMVVVILSQMSTEGVVILGVIALVYCAVKLWLDGE